MITGIDRYEIKKDKSIDSIIVLIKNNVKAWCGVFEVFKNTENICLMAIH
jgi:hypothetical protein